MHRLQMRIREFRLRKKITQKELADAIGVTLSTIYRYEQGSIKPSVQHLQQLADTLNVSIVDLCSDPPLTNLSDLQIRFDSTDELLAELDKVRQPSKTIIEMLSVYAKGRCELCQNPAPFIGPDGLPFLELHFVKWLSEGGTESLENAVLLCPNCHKRIHVISASDDLKKIAERAATHI